jgi:hypothetical protein
MSVGQRVFACRADGLGEPARNGERVDVLRRFRDRLGKVSLGCMLMARNSAAGFTADIPPALLADKLGPSNCRRRLIQGSRHCALGLCRTA